MIIYHPRNDIYHCMYRFLVLTNLINSDAIEFNRLRIYDFIYLFPHFINEMTLPRAKGLTAIKREILALPMPYESLPDKRRLFSQMSDYHIQAMQILTAKGIFEEKNGLIYKSDNYGSVKELIEANSKSIDESFSKLFGILNKVILEGSDGLKERSGLMEHRYDAV
ncbi:TPA: hypothetical protein NKA98_003190 [Vibrio parahaemolyticus]|nr:hypothetical protein [Vibrio parahaemolyticus]